MKSVEVRKTEYQYIDIDITISIYNIVYVKK